MVSDGCTGFTWAEWIWPIRACCEAHDAGGSDGALLDCWTGAGMPIGIAGLALLVMIIARPIYRLIKKLFTRP